MCYNEIIMKEGKYIHYCWFGGKPLPKLARKCLQSWKKFLPDYEIIRWDEKNCNFDECEFVKRAYETKYYAFVADYVRTKAMCEYGGIYFDTDMEVIKDPKKLLNECKSFLGVEDTGKVCCGVWYERYPNGYLATELLKKYRSFKNVDFNKRSEFSIPLLITEILEPCGFDYKKRRVQVLKHDITIFPRDYFYPYSYSRTNNLFTDNTCMVHYYDASWLPFKSRIEKSLVRKFGRVRAIQMIKAYQKTYEGMRRVARVVLFPVTLHIHNKKKSKKITLDYLRRVDDLVAEIGKYSGEKYITFHNGEWFGVTSATRELFDNCIDLRELYRRKDIIAVANAVVKSGVDQVVFSALSIGGPELIKAIHKRSPNIRMKVYWHGSMSQVLDKYGWGIHEEIMKLYRDGTITAFATCKKSLYNFYRENGVNAYFITNKVEVPFREMTHSHRKKIRVGIYAASTSNWRKNLYSQMAAVALIDGAVLDMVPLDSRAKVFAKRIGLRLEGVEGNISREELIRRMCKNDVNLYVTYSECAPMLPLESMRVGVPCLTGNNHHYFKGTKLKKYLVVDQETNIELIKQKIVECVKHRADIIEQYKKFDEDNLKNSVFGVKMFLEGDKE